MLIAPIRADTAASKSEPELNSTEELIAALAQGEMIVVVDDEDRENEGDLIVAAEFARPDVINFMTMHGRGLICLALAAEWVDALGLPPMCEKNRCPKGTAFTISIDAKSGITTGISAFDRSHTIAVALNKPGDELISPGHVFPLRARPGGVLERRGHTEAAVDLARLAGQKPAAVICEVLSESGKMARLTELHHFARLYNLKIGTVADLVRFREHRDSYKNHTRHNGVVAEAI